jgi:methionyl-tRNA formyltransferase
MKRILIIAPIDSSAFALCLMVRIASLRGIEVSGVLIRTITLQRVIAEWRRDGMRLVKKFWSKHIRRGASVGSAIDTTAWHQLRGMGLGKDYISEVCLNRGIRFLKTPDLNSNAAVDFVRECAVDLSVFGGGGMVRAPLRDACGSGVLNCHMGPLPAYRGMDVVEWPFLEQGRAARTAVTVHFMDDGLDTGPVVEVADMPRDGCGTIADLRTAAEGLKIEALLRAVELFERGALVPHAQDLRAGRQYFVMHPALAEIASKRAAKALGDFNHENSTAVSG